MELFIDLVQIYSGTNPNDQCYDAPATHYVWTRLLKKHNNCSGQSCEDADYENPDLNQN